MFEGQARIRPLSHVEQRELVFWAAQEGWNPGLHDAELFWQIDSDGFLGIEVNGELAGGGAIIRHHSRFGFMGLFIMRPEYRGHKLGTKLWYARRDALLARLDPGATIGLDAVESMVPFYSRGGFVPQTRHQRFEWNTPGDPPSLPEDVIPLETVDSDQLESFDRTCFPVPRSRYLRLWTRQADAHALALVRRGTLRGFGVMRRCLIGWKVGPLFAECQDDAQQLLQAFAHRGAGQKVYLDAPENSASAMQLCHSLGMKQVFSCVRMYLGPTPHVVNERIYSITNFEIG